MPVPGDLGRSAAIFRERHRHDAVRWMKPEQLHITLLPPWQCTDTDKVCHILHDVAMRHSSLEVAFDRVSAGPSGDNRRIVWATGKASKRVCDLHRDLQTAVCIDGYRCEREFLLHLTLARFRAGGSGGAVKACLNEPVEWRGTLTSIVLYESELRPEGVQYRVLCEHGLRSV
jgi:2'-5' RNA ligase